VENLGPAEHWILERCRQTVETVEAAYADYQFGEVARMLYDAIWSEYCDWFVEIAKIGLAEAGARAETTWWTLVWVLDRYLRLLHPLMPHVTEELWSRLPHLSGDPDLLIVARWPTHADGMIEPDQHLADGTAKLIEFVAQMRTARAESGIPAADWLPARVWLGDAGARAAYLPLEAAIARLARVQPTLIDERADIDAGGSSLAVVGAVGEARLMRSAADRERERQRLAKELAGLEDQLGTLEHRLADGSFVAKAPPAVVESTRRRALKLRDQVTTLNNRMREI
jgi:valyl-tRNA synthetase